MDGSQSPAVRPRMPLSTEEFFTGPETADHSAEGEPITSRAVVAEVERRLNLSPREQSEWRRLLLEAS